MDIDFNIIINYCKGCGYNCKNCLFVDIDDKNMESCLFNPAPAQMNINKIIEVYYKIKKDIEATKKGK